MGTLEKIKFKILKDTLGSCYKNGQETLFFCPKCRHHKRKLSVNIARNVFKCWVCEYSGVDLYKLVKRYGTRNSAIEWKQFSEVVEINNFDKLFEVEEKEDDSRSELNLPKEFISLTGRLSKSLVRPYNYLINRGLTKQDILDWRIGCCLEGQYKNRIIVPSFDSQGYLNYFVARSFDNSFMRYKNPPTSRDVIFNEIDIDWGSPVVLVEGVFDAIRADNAIPILGSSLRPETKLFQRLIKESKKVYLALDEDARKKTMSIIKNLFLYDLTVCNIDTSGYEDIAEMPKQEFLNRKQQSQQLTQDDFFLYRTEFA